MADHEGAKRGSRRAEEKDDGESKKTATRITER